MESGNGETLQRRDKHGTYLIPDIKAFQRGIQERVGPKIAGGKVIKVEAHPIPMHPRPVRVRGRLALIGDAAGYVTKCSGEGIYFAAESGRMCGEAIVKASEGGLRMVREEDLTREYLRKWDSACLSTYKILDLVQNIFYGSNAAREALVELCGDEYMQRFGLDFYMYKRLSGGNQWDNVRLSVNAIGILMRSKIIGREMAALKF